MAMVIANKNLFKMASQDRLSQSLASTELPLLVRRAIINGIFQIDLTPENFLSWDNGLQAWFNDWFEEQCQATANQVSVKTHRDLLHILAYLQSADRNTTRTEVAEQICVSTSIANLEDERLNASLTLAARIWLSVSIDSLRHFFALGYFICWNKNQTLSDALDKELCPKSQASETVKLPKVFTAANLEKIAGIQVQWTSNLADHLVLKDDDTKVMLFHQASFLELSKQSKRYSRDPCGR